MTRTYQLIDTDQHVNEPPDLWTTRLPARFRERAPRIESFAEGDAWILEGVDAPINFGLNSCAGKSAEDAVAWCRWSEVRAGGYDPAARLVELDRDHIDACLLYPTPRLSHSVIANPDPDFHLALVRAYNDWLAEYCGHAPDRLGGVFLIPNRGIDMAVAEIERMAPVPGIRGALLGCYPHGDLNLAGDEDDAVWHALAERNLPVQLHVSLVNDMPAMHDAKIPGDVRFFDAPKRILQFVWARVFERVPDLKLVVVEVDCGWLPYLKEQADDRFRRMGLGAKLDLDRPPSHFIRNHMWFTYITDHYGLRNRHDVGVDRMMWSSDYPHVGSNWPNSWRVINAEMSGVPVEERELLLAGNARALYGFGAPVR
jgi:predicted TIM-barrel fold metal-dependent hydrolase